MEFAANIGDLARRDRTEWIKNKIKEGQKAFAMHQLETKLAKIIKTANGHRKNKLPKYAPAYYILCQRAEDLIAEFAKDYDVNPDDIYAQIPAMKELQDWAIKPHQSPRAIQFLASLVGIAIGAFVVGLTTGGLQCLFHYGWALAHFTK